MATVVVGTLICELVTVLVFAVIGRFEPWRDMGSPVGEPL